MAVVTSNSTIESIISEVRKLNTLEQKEILTQIRIMQLKNKLPAYLNPSIKKLRVLTKSAFEKMFV